MSEILNSEYPENQKPNSVMTKPGYLFFENVFRVNALWQFIIRMMVHSQKLDDLKRSIDDYEEKRLPVKNPSEYMQGRYQWRDEFDFHESTLGEVCFSRTINSFSIFLDDLLALIFSIEKRLLISKEKMAIDEILSSNSMDEVIGKIIVKKCHEITYKSLSAKLNYLKDDIGLKFDLSNQHIDDLILLTEIRNILVHNGGYVNEIFLQKTKTNSFVLGQKIKIDTIEASDATLCCAEAIRIIEASMLKKFGESCQFKKIEEYLTDMGDNYKNESGKFTKDIINIITGEIKL